MSISLKDYLISLGYEYTPKLDGSWERFPINGKENVGWLVGSEISASFGNWSTGEKFFWENTDTISSMTEEELNKFRLAQKEHQEKVQQEKIKRQEEAKKLAQNIWKTSAYCNSHEYLTKKKVKSYGLRVTKHGQLVIPIVINKEVVSLQFIEPTGEKRFLPGAKLAGGYFFIGNTESNRIYLCEGYATGASILEAYPEHGVCIAFNAGNLPRVAEYLATKNKEIVIAADNDVHTQGNPGVTAAKECLKYLPSAKISPPTFPDEILKEYKPTDWNDVHTLISLERVREGLNSTTSSLPIPKKTNSIKSMLIESIHIRPMEWPRGKDNKPRKPTQNEIGEELASLFGENLLREKREVFEWRTTHWVELEPINFKHFIRQKAQVLMSGHATDKDLNAYFNIFMDKLACIPTHMSFYQQLPNISNFLDGTLRIETRQDNTKKLAFTPHSKLDFCTWVLPYEYTAPRPKNEVFDRWLESTFEGDQEKIRAVAQIGGACLIPAIPRIIFFKGPAGTGKSTFAKLCSAFMGEGNFAACPPEEMHGFMMESLIGKRVNIVTDTSGGRVDSGTLKRLQDSTNILVNRKGRQAVQASIPYFHIFCGNELPKGIDGDSNAMDRRVSIINMTKELAQKEMRHEYEREILAGGRGAILDFFEKGLLDLIQSGKFFNPTSSVESVREWKKDNSPVSQFLESLEKGDVEGLRVNPEGKIRQKDVYEAYIMWCGKNTRLVVSRVAIFRLVATKYVKFSAMGYDYFKGIELIGQDLRGV